MRLKLGGEVDPELIAVFNDLLAVERTKLNDQLQRDIGAEVSRLSANGTLRSGVALKVIASTAGNVIPIFAQVALTLMLRALKAHGVGLGKNNRDSVAAEIKGHIDSEISELQAKILETPSYRSMPEHAASALGHLDRLAALEMQRIYGELRLIATASEEAPPPAGSTNVFNAPVGLVQTGAGSFGFSTQHLDNGARGALEKAMDALLKDLDEYQSKGTDVRMSEARELAVETKTEVVKPKPNLTKVKSLVAGIGGAISFTPKLKEAYDTVKWAAAMIEVPLP